MIASPSVVMSIDNNIDVKMKLEYTVFWSSWSVKRSVRRTVITVHDITVFVGDCYDQNINATRPSTPIGVYISVIFLDFKNFRSRDDGVRSQENRRHSHQHHSVRHRRLIALVMLSRKMFSSTRKMDQRNDGL